MNFSKHFARRAGSSGSATSISPNRRKLSRKWGLLSFFRMRDRPVGFWRWFVAPAGSPCEDVPKAARGLNWMLAFLLVATFFAFAFYQLQYAWNWPGVLAYREAFLRGWVMTLVLSAAALVLSTTLGVIIAAARRSSV